MKPLLKSRFRIVPLATEDLDQVIEIEKTAFPYPWSRNIFQRELTYDWAHLIGRLDEQTAHLVAYVNYWLVYDEGHVLNIAVDRDGRPQGPGRAPLAHGGAFA